MAENILTLLGKSIDRMKAIEEAGRLAGITGKQEAIDIKRPKDEDEDDDEE